MTTKKTRIKHAPEVKADQCLIVLLPVADFLLDFSHHMRAAVMI